MTYLIGTITITYDELVSKLGSPRGRSDEKSHVEWALSIPGKDYSIYIYDWKEEKMPYGVYDWHIGGYDLSDIDIIQNLFKDKKIIIEDKIIDST